MSTKKNPLRPLYFNKKKKLFVRWRRKFTKNSKIGFALAKSRKFDFQRLPILKKKTKTSITGAQFKRFSNFLNFKNNRLLFFRLFLMLLWFFQKNRYLWTGPLFALTKFYQINHIWLLRRYAEKRAQALNSLYGWRGATPRFNKFPVSINETIGACGFLTNTAAKRSSDRPLFNISYSRLFNDQAIILKKRLCASPLRKKKIYYSYVYVKIVKRPHFRSLLKTKKTILLMRLLSHLAYRPYETRFLYNKNLKIDFELVKFKLLDVQSDAFLQPSKTKGLLTVSLFSTLRQDLFKPYISILKNIKITGVNGRFPAKALLLFFASYPLLKLNSPIHSYFYFHFFLALSQNDFKNKFYFLLNLNAYFVTNRGLRAARVSALLPQMATLAKTWIANKAFLGVTRLQESSHFKKLPQFSNKQVFFYFLMCSMNEKKNLLFSQPLLFKTLYSQFFNFFFFNKTFSALWVSRIKQFFSFSKKIATVSTNIFYDKNFLFFWKKHILRSLSYFKLSLITFSWQYLTLLKFLEFISGKKIYFKFYSLLLTELTSNEITRCALWSYRLRSFKRAFGVKLFLIESLKIIYTALKLKDLYFFSDWILKFFYKISFWKYKMIFRYLYYVLRHFYKPYFQEIGVKGVKFQLKGKVSVAGNARTRVIRNKIGSLGHSSFKNRVLTQLNLLKTFTGVIGFKFWLVF